MIMLMNTDEYTTTLSNKKLFSVVSCQTDAGLATSLQDIPQRDNY